MQAASKKKTPLTKKREQLYALIEGRGMTFPMLNRVLGFSAGRIESYLYDRLDDTLPNSAWNQLNELLRSPVDHLREDAPHKAVAIISKPTAPAASNDSPAKAPAPPARKGIFKEGSLLPSKSSRKGGFPRIIGQVNGQAARPVRGLWNSNAFCRMLAPLEDIPYWLEANDTGSHTISSDFLVEVGPVDLPSIAPAGSMFLVSPSAARRVGDLVLVEHVDSRVIPYFAVGHDGDRFLFRDLLTPTQVALTPTDFVGYYRATVSPGGQRFTCEQVRTKRNPWGDWS